MHPEILYRAVIEPTAPIAQSRPGDRHFMDSPQTEYNMKMKLRLQVQHEEEEINKPLTRVDLYNLVVRLSLGFKYSR